MLLVAGHAVAADDRADLKASLKEYEQLVEKAKAKGQDGK